MKHMKADQEWVCAAVAFHGSRREGGHQSCAGFAHPVVEAFAVAGLSAQQQAPETGWPARFCVIGAMHGMLLDVVLKGPPLAQPPCSVGSESSNLSPGFYTHLLRK